MDVAYMVSQKFIEKDMLAMTGLPANRISHRASPPLGKRVLLLLKRRTPKPKPVPPGATPTATPKATR